MRYLSERLNAAQSGGGSEDGPRQQPLADDQRRRILAATEQLAAERGYAGTSIERIDKLARVSSITFYEHFAGKEEAFVAAFDHAVGETLALLRREVSADRPWPERIREGLRVLLAVAAANPARARMCLVEAPRGGPQLLAHYETVLDGAALKLREGRRLDPAEEELPAALEETTVGGLAFLLRERLETVGVEGIEELLPQLADIALRPYLDPPGGRHLEAAREGR
jgi:AcrR family transcriptional regulator